MDPHLLVSIGFALSVFFIFFGIDRIIHSKSSSIESRLDRYAARQIAAPMPDETGSGKAKKNRFGRLASGSFGAQIQTDLARADIRLTAGEFIMVNLGATVVGFLLGLVVFHGNLIFALFGGLGGFYFPKWYVRFLQRKRVAAFNNQLGDTIILLANSLRSGYSLMQSMETVAKELPPPVSVEFARVTREIGLGLSVQDALSNLLRRIPSEDLDLMITAVNVQHEVGGNLAEILDTIAHTIRERVRIVGEIRAITSQQRLSGTVLSLLPGFLGLVMYALNPGYVSNLWSNMCGWIMLGTGGLLIAIGYFVIRKIVSIEV